MFSCRVFTTVSLMLWNEGGEEGVSLSVSCKSTLHRPLPVEQSSVIRAGVLLHAWVDGFARVVGVLVRVAESFGVVVLFFGFL